MKNQTTIPVIIADDESSIRNGLLSAIPWDTLNMKVMGCAKDGVEAWDLIQTIRPRIVITDIRMPRLSGLDLIKRCHEHQLETQFIILSGYDDFSYAQTAIRYGAKAYVLKPLKKDELMAELESLKEDAELYGSIPANLSSYHELSRKIFFNQLVKNEFHHDSDIRYKMEELRLNLPDNFFQIIIFLFVPDSGKDIAPILEQGKSLLLSSQKALQSHIWENDKSCLCMLCPLLSKHQIHHIVHQLSDGLQPLHCQVFAGIGTAEESLMAVEQSYNKALTALSYRLYESGLTVFDQSVICTQAPDISISNMDNQKLLNAIRKNQRILIESNCRSFFDSLLYVPMPPPSFIRGMSIYLVTDIQNALRKQMEENLAIFSELPYMKINRLTSLHQIIEWCTSLFLIYGQVVSQYISSRKEHIILEAKQFIQEHMNQKIQAEDVASVVNFSPSYFTIYFKTKTGVNFRDYVLNVKMEQAKHLLETGSANISEISCAVGYDDYRSFYRAFKNHTGMTPSEYQTKHGY